MLLDDYLITYADSRVDIARADAAARHIRRVYFMPIRRRRLSPDAFS